MENVLIGRVPFRNSSTGAVEEYLWGDNRPDAKNLYKEINDKITNKKIPKPCFAHVGLESSDYSCDKTDSNKRLL